MKSALALVLIFCGAFPAPARQRRAKHQVALSWTDSNPAGVQWDVYRGNGLCSTALFSRIALGLSVKSYADRNVSGGSTYCYYVTATLNGLSAASASAAAVIPH
jgi:hypothetical protein